MRVYRPNFKSTIAFMSVGFAGLLGVAIVTDWPVGYKLVTVCWLLVTYGLQLDFTCRPIMQGDRDAISYEHLDGMAIQTIQRLNITDVKQFNVTDRGSLAANEFSSRAGGVFRELVAVLNDGTESPTLFKSTVNRSNLPYCTCTHLTRMVKWLSMSRPCSF